MDTSSLMEQILSGDNLKRAYLQVVRNKGAEGMDGMKYTELKEYLVKNGEIIKEQLRTRKYKPQPVRRVEIQKPDGGVRNLGVPTVTDRFIQQAIAQILTPIYEEQFHEHSYGFRPNRCAQQAILTALDMMNDGNNWIVDIDLEKFFDTVNHDRPISKNKDWSKAKHETGICYSTEITCEGSIWQKDDTKCENLRCKAVSYKIAAGRWEKL